MTRITGLALCAVLTFAAAPAYAQRRPVRPFVERGFVSFSGGAQLAAPALADRFAFQANAEAGAVDARYPGTSALLIDGGAGVRVSRRLGVAISVSRATGSGRVAVSAEIPHPFFDNRDRHVDGEADGMSRTETVVHAQLYYEAPARGRWRLRLSAGPSYFNVHRELVTSVQAEETFPYDTAAFGGTETGRARGSGIGFNAGIDVQRMVTRRVGAGVLVRYTRASLDLNASDARRVSVTGGGIQAGAGLRFVF